MNKMLVWFHAFPELPEGEEDYQDLSQIKLTVFKPVDNAEPEQIFNGSFAEFTDFSGQDNHFDEAEVILPAEVVLYTQVTVPSKSRNRILQALPFILDDALINDTSRQHFALGEVKSGQCHIAILSHAIINIIIRQFHQLSIAVSWISSEIFQLPWQKKQWSIGFINDKILIRTGSQSGVVNNVENLDFVLRLLLNEQQSDEVSEDSGVESEAADSASSIIENIDLPDKLVVYSSDNNDVIEQLNKIANEFSCELEQQSENLQDMIFSTSLNNNKKTAADNIGINLLQGKYLSGTYKQAAIPFKKTLVAVLLLVFCAQVFFMTYQWRTYNMRLSQLEEQLETLYFKTFPDSKRLIDVRSQTLSKLEQLQNQSSDESSFLRILGVVGDEVRKNRSIKIQSLHFNDGILQLDIVSRDFIFNSLKQNLEKKYNMTVEERSSSREKGEVHSVINFIMK